MDMQTGWNENRALLRGTAAAEPVPVSYTHLAEVDHILPHAQGEMDNV